VDAREHLQQRRLAGAVATQEAEGLAGGHLEGDVAHGPEVLVDRRATAHEGRLQRLVALVVQPELLGDVVDDDGRLGHSSSANRFSDRENTAYPMRKATRAAPRHQRLSPSVGSRLLYSRSRNAWTKCSMGLRR